MLYIYEKITSTLVYNNFFLLTEDKYQDLNF
jgi:hypothetical protein